MNKPTVTSMTAKWRIEMTTFSTFTRDNLKSLRNELAAVLNKYGIDSNLDIEVGNMRFSANEVEIKINAKIKGAVTIQDTVLEAKIKALGLVKEKNGYKLVRYDSKKYKMPFIYELNGKMYKTSEQHARFLFAA